MFARAVRLAVILRPGRCLLADPDASLIQISAASDPDPGARARPHRRRRALVPSMSLIQIGDLLRHRFTPKLFFGRILVERRRFSQDWTNVRPESDQIDLVGDLLLD